MRKDNHCFKFIPLNNLHLIGCRALIILFLATIPNSNITSIFNKTKIEFVNSEQFEFEDTNTDIEDTFDDEKKVFVMDFNECISDFKKHKIVVKHEKLSKFLWVNLNIPPPRLV